MENTVSEFKTLTAVTRRTAQRRRERYALPMMTAAMMTSDLAGLVLAGSFAILTRWIAIGPFKPNLLVWFGPVAGLMLILFSMRHLYPGIGLGAVAEFRSLTIWISVIFIIESMLFFALQEGSVVSRFVFMAFWMASMVTIPALRRLTRHEMTQLGLWGEPMAIIGEAEAALKLYDRLTGDPKIGLKPVVIFTTGGEGRELRIKADVHPIEQLEKVRQGYPMRMAAVLYEEMDEVETISTRYRESFERLVLFNIQGNHHFLNKVSIQHYGGLISLAVHHRLLDPWAQALKRTIDILISGAAIVLLSPFFLIATGLICLDSRGGIFYRQQRLGKRGTSFAMLKFRTMYTNADEVLETTLGEDQALQQEWDKYQKLRKDPRITRVGRILRRFSMDELPQLWNVLRGEMSLVGPRPLMVNQQQVYGENWQHYVRVLPGISGLWQINGRNQTSFLRRAELDMEYVISWSVWLDIYIIMRTLWVVLRREGAY